MDSTAGQFDSEKARCVIFGPRKHNIHKTIKFIALIVSKLSDKRRIHDCRYLVEKSIEILNKAPLLQTFLLFELDTACDTRPQRSTLLTYYIEHEKLLEDLNERELQVFVLLSTAAIFQQTEQYSNAIECTVKALTIASEIESNSGKWRSHSGLGNAYFSLGQYEKAIEHHEKGLAICREIGDRSGIANNYGNLGNACCHLGKYYEGIKLCESALAINFDIGDKSGIASNNGSLGYAYHGLGQYEKAIKYYENGLDISLEIGDQSKIARAYGSLGNAYRCMGQYEKAIEYCEKGLIISLETENRSGIANGHMNLGSVYQRFGQYEEALGFYEKSLRTSLEIGDRLGIGHCYGNLGNVYSSLGQFEKALEYCEKGLAISHEIEDSLGISNNNTNLGNTYRNLGLYKEAIEYFKKALDISLEIGDRRGIANNTMNAGNSYFNLGKGQKAIKHYEKSLAISDEIGDRLGMANSYGNLGNAYNSLGQYQKAIEYSEKGLDISLEIGDRSGIADNNARLGTVYHSIGQNEKAIEYCENGLDVSIEIGNQCSQAIVRANMGECFFDIALSGSTFLRGVSYSNLACLEKAASCLLESIQAGDGILSELSSDENRASFISQFFQWYQSLAGVFSLVLRIEAALLVLDLGKAKALQVSIEERKQLKEHFTNSYAHETWKKIIDHEERNRFCDVANILNENKSKFTLLFYCFDRNGSLNIWIVNSDQKILRRIWKPPNHENMSAESWIFTNSSDLLNNIAAKFTRDFSFNSKRPSNIYPEKLAKNVDISDAQKYVEGKFLSAEASSEIFDEFSSEIVSRGKTLSCGVIFSSRISKVFLSRTEILENLVQPYDLANEFSKRQLPSLKRTSRELTNEGGDSDIFYDRSIFAENLYQALINPVKDLIKGTKLIIVPDKFLFFLPFCCFVDEHGHCLSDKYSIQMTPSIHTLFSSKMTPIQTSPGPALFIGNPNVGEVLFRGKSLILPSLSYAAQEAKTLASRFEAKALIENAATKQNVLKCIPHSSIVHIAAHGDEKRGEIFLSPNPDWRGKGFALPDEEFYLLREIDIVNLQVTARLVVLCCCHTGRGKMSSEGIIGVARSFLGAGARSVLVTLWRVDDKYAKEFMSHFYDEIFGGTSVCEALKRTMIVCQRNANREYRSFYNWAPFTIFGEDINLTEEAIVEIKRRSREAPRLS